MIEKHKQSEQSNPSSRKPGIGEVRISHRHPACSIDNLVVKVEALVRERVEQSAAKLSGVT